MDLWKTFANIRGQYKRSEALVYNYAQHKLRKSLKLANETLPNQLGKPVKNPTMRWIFQLMEGIAIVKLYNPVEKSFRAMITNLNDTRIKIIRLLGKTACLIYGIQMEIAGIKWIRKNF